MLIIDRVKKENEKSLSKGAGLVVVRENSKGERVIVINQGTLIIEDIYGDEFVKVATEVTKGRGVLTYFVNENESDENGSVWMFDGNGDLLSDNIHAYNSLFELVEKKRYLWIDKDFKKNFEGYLQMMDEGE